MNSRSYILVSSIFILVSAAACSSKRPETASYFKEVTGISICKNASIKNKRYGPHDYASEPIYQVIIRSDQKCLTQLNDEIIDTFGIDCKFPISDNCTFTDKKMNWYNIEKKSDGSLVFRLSFT